MHLGLLERVVDRKFDRHADQIRISRNTTGDTFEKLVLRNPYPPVDVSRQLDERGRPDVIHIAFSLRKTPFTRFGITLEEGARAVIKRGDVPRYRDETDVVARHDAGEPLSLWRQARLIGKLLMA